MIGLPWWFSSKESTSDAEVAGDTGLIPGSGRPAGGGHGNPCQYSCLENPNDRGAWWATVHGAEKSWTQLMRPTHRATVGYLSCGGVGGGRSWNSGEVGQGCSPASCSAQDRSPLKPCCMLTFCGPLPFPPYHTPDEVEHLSPFLRQEKEGSERFSHLPKITQQLWGRVGIGTRAAQLQLLADNHWPDCKVFRCRVTVWACISNTTQEYFSSADFPLSH